MSYEDDITHEEMFTHKCGKVYRVRWVQDFDMGTPLEWSDCHGIVVDMNWNPLNAEQLEQHILDEEPDLEEETRLRMLRPLFRYDRRTVHRLYYDFSRRLTLHVGSGDTRLSRIAPRRSRLTTSISRVGMRTTGTGCDLRLCR